MSSRMTEHKIILVKRKTRLEELIVRYNTVQQARFFIERLGADFSDYVLEDENYRRAVATTTSELTALGRVQIVEREHVPNFIFGEQDTVVVLGQDGLVANTLKYLTEQPLIGVNQIRCVGTGCCCHLLYQICAGLCQMYSCADVRSRRLRWLRHS
ncbi:NAD kinase [Paenibacillus sp. RC62]